MRAFIVVLAALLLSSCGDDLDGVVTNKNVQPGYSYTYMQPMTTTTCSGTPSVCRTTTTGYLPIFYYVPTCWEITVEGSTSGDTCVSEEKWNSLMVGDEYVGPDAKPKDFQVKK